MNERLLQWTKFIQSTIMQEADGALDEEDAMLVIEALCMNLVRLSRDLMKAPLDEADLHYEIMDLIQRHVDASVEVN